MRVDEFKYTWTTEVQDSIVQKGDVGGFSGGIFVDTGGGIMFNLYATPQEDVSVGVRHIPMWAGVVSSAAAYMQELIKYPPQFKIGFLSNNPPVYDLLPKAKDALERFEQEGLGKQPRPQ